MLLCVHSNTGTGKTACLCSVIYDARGIKELCKSGCFWAR